MSDNNDDLAGWGGSTGFALADAEATITEFEFGYDSRMGENPVAKITFEVEDSSEPAVQMYSVGSHWVVKEAGAALRHESGDESKLINKSTNYYAFFDAAAGIAEARKYFRENNATPYDATTFVGTRWHMTQIEIPRKNMKSGEMEMKTLVVPDAFLGVIGAPAAAAKSAAVAKTATKAVAAKKTTAATSKVLPLDQLIPDDDLRNTLLDELNKILADDAVPAAKKHDAFVAEAFQYEGVEGVGSVETAVMAHNAESFFGQVSAAFGK